MKARCHAGAASVGANANDAPQVKASPTSPTKFVGAPPLLPLQRYSDARPLRSDRASAARNTHLPRPVEQSPHCLRSVDLARIGVHPTVVHRPFGNTIE